MTTRPMTKQEAALGTPYHIEESSTAAKSGQQIKPQKIMAGYLSPACEHDWLKLENDLQTLESEGKTIWKCRTCDEVTNTYNWQTP